MINMFYYVALTWPCPVWSADASSVRRLQPVCISVKRLSPWPVCDELGSWLPVVDCS